MNTNAADGLNWNQTVYGVKSVVKGVSKRVIVVKSPDPRIFEEAIFIVKEDVLQRNGVTKKDVLKQAHEVADEYMRRNVPVRRRKLPRIPPAAAALMGAIAASLVFILSSL